MKNFIFYFFVTVQNTFSFHLTLLSTHPGKIKCQKSVIKQNLYYLNFCQIFFLNFGPIVNTGQKWIQDFNVAPSQYWNPVKRGIYWLYVYSLFLAFRIVSFTLCIFVLEQGRESWHEEVCLWICQVLGSWFVYNNPFLINTIQIWQVNPFGMKEIQTAIYQMLIYHKKLNIFISQQIAQRIFTTKKLTRSRRDL